MYYKNKIIILISFALTNEILLCFYYTQSRVIKNTYFISNLQVLFISDFNVTHADTYIYYIIHILYQLSC